VYASDAAFNLSDGDFTIELWAYELPTTLGTFVCRRPGGTATGWAWTHNGLRARINGAWSDTQMTWSLASLNEWHHYALCRSGSTLRMFIDGALAAALAGVTTIDDLPGVNVFFGQADSAGENRFDGYMDEVRWTNGVALYTSNFIPLNAPFPDS
jgi:hypothetical protein